MKLIIKNKEIIIKPLETETARKISKNKDFSSNIKTWGDEIYFKTPIKGVKIEENARNIVNFGELAYWVEGNSIAIGFGPTPVSINNEIRLVTKVNVWAEFNTTLYDVNFFKSLNDNDVINFIN